MRDNRKNYFHDNTDDNELTSTVYTTVDVQSYCSHLL